MYPHQIAVILYSTKHFMGKKVFVNTGLLIGPIYVPPGLVFAGYVPPASQNPYPIIDYSMAKYRPHLSHFWENVIFAIPT